MAPAMEPQGDVTNPKTAEEAHANIVRLAKEALEEHRSVFMVTMQPLVGNQLMDVRSVMMNLDQHEKGIVMVAFAVVQMNKKSGTDIRRDLEKLAEYATIMAGE